MAFFESPEKVLAAANLRSNGFLRRSCRNDKRQRSRPVLVHFVLGHRPDQRFIASMKGRENAIGQRHPPCRHIHLVLPSNGGGRVSILSK